MSVPSPSRTLNINLGILGHVDSGKTSLAKALSTHLSTASLDKIPQSQARGITLDLGFSAFYIDSNKFKDNEIKQNYDRVQITLVDCPGHASLIRTIIGGAAIIDCMLLVIDSNKGIQTQTAECLVIGEILTENLIVVLNKCDLIANQPDKMTKLEKGLINTMKQTKFGDKVKIVKVSANPGSSDSLTIENNNNNNSNNKHTKDQENKESVIVQPPNVLELVDYLCNSLTVPVRSAIKSPFQFSVDHCFMIKGQGTVLTGTVLSGNISVGHIIEIPALKIEKKVKSMQMFKLPVEYAQQGDRVGICVAQLEAKLVERGILCTPGSIPDYQQVIITAEKIRFFKQKVLSKAKFHVSIGHSTIMATVQFFTLNTIKNTNTNDEKSTETSGNSIKTSEKQTSVPALNSFDFKQEYLFAEELLPTSPKVPSNSQFAILTFEKPVLCPEKVMLIGSKLDADINLNQCRLAFQGKLLTGLQYIETGVATTTSTNNTSSSSSNNTTNDNTNISSNNNSANTLHSQNDLHIYKLKERTGVIDRISDDYSLIGRDLFQKGSDITLFIGLTVQLDNGQLGRIEGGFGKGGKFKVIFNDKLLSEDGKGVKGKIYLRYKKYLFQQHNKKAFSQIGIYEK